MKLLPLFFSTLFSIGISFSASAAEMTVIDVRRNITLADKDPIYKDFFINTGANSGLKKNLVVNVIRKINIRDSGGTNADGEILVPVGQLKIIAIYEKVAVAREFSLFPRDELPMLEQIGIMTGDQIEIKGSFIDSNKPKKVAETSATPKPTVEIALIKSPADIQKNKAQNSKAELIKSSPPERLEKVAISDNKSGHE